MPYPHVLNVYLQGLVCAGLADMARPAEKLSTAQSTVLMATGKLKASIFHCYRTLFLRRDEKMSTPYS